MDQDRLNAELFGQLDNLKPDVYMTGVIEKAADIEGLIDESDLNADELNTLTTLDLVNEEIDLMNKSCPYINKPVIVSGRLKQAYYDELSEEFGTEDVELSDEVLISHGYTVLVFSDEAGEVKRKVGHLFVRKQMSPRNDSPALVDYVTRLFAFAPVGTIEIGYDSDDKDTIRILEQNIPDVIDEIDSLILDSNNECEALMSLALHTFSDKQDIPVNIMSKLLSYVGRRLDFDTILPYVATIDGFVYDEANNSLVVYKYKESDDSNFCVLIPQSLTLQRYSEIDTSGQLNLSEEYYWCLAAIVTNSNPSGPHRELTIPVRNLRSIRSVRSMLFVD